MTNETATKPRRSKGDGTIFKNRVVSESRHMKRKTGAVGRKK